MKRNVNITKDLSRNEDLSFAKLCSKIFYLDGWMDFNTV